MRTVGVGEAAEVTYTVEYNETGVPVSITIRHPGGHITRVMADRVQVEPVNYYSDEYTGLGLFPGDYRQIAIVLPRKIASDT